MPRPRKPYPPTLLSALLDPKPALAYLANVDSLWVLCDERATSETLDAEIIAPDERHVYYGFVSKEAAEAHRRRIGAPETFKPVEFRRVPT